MAISNEFLGYYDTKNNKIVTVRKNILMGIRSNGNKQIEEALPHKVFIWGGEDSNELYQKIISRGTERERYMVGLLIKATKLNNRDEARGCFILLKKYDTELYNSFGDEFLKDMGLSTSKWWKNWVLKAWEWL